MVVAIMSFWFGHTSPRADQKDAAGHGDRWRPCGIDYGCRDEFAFPLDCAGDNEVVHLIRLGSSDPFQFMGTPPKDKKLVIYEDGHGAFSRPAAVREVLDWLDKYLGRVSQ